MTLFPIATAITLVIAIVKNHYNLVMLFYTVYTSYLQKQYESFLENIFLSDKANKKKKKKKKKKESVEEVQGDSSDTGDDISSRIRRL